MAKKGNRQHTAVMAAPRQIEYEPVDNLLLDERNPRFASELEDTSQDSIVRVLWRDFSVDEVALSIAANGFFREEPLLVVPRNEDKPDGKFVVVEGNRRFAAVLLLRDTKLRTKIKATNLPQISNEAIAALAQVPVSKYASRQEIWRYLGFRHINGPQPWDSFSKAMYVASVHDEHGISLDEIADSIGDRHATVKRLYRGYKILEQAESKTSFQRDDRIAKRFFFSHLYTAVDQEPFQRFLGITSEDSLRPNPVPKSKFNELRELMVWFYGSKSEKRLPIVQQQNPDLNILREVISDARGVEALRAGLTLQRAHEISLGDERRFRSALIRAKEELQLADGTLTTGYEGDEDNYEVFRAISLIVNSVGERMQTKRKNKVGAPM
jgi:hypothetical protein